MSKPKRVTEKYKPPEDRVFERNQNPPKNIGTLQTLAKPVKVTEKYKSPLYDLGGTGGKK